MIAYLKVWKFWYQMDHVNNFCSFFDNICYHLENGKWGSRFPTVMVDLYEYEVVTAKLEKLREELAIIKKEFSKILVEKLIWRLDNKEIPSSFFKNLSDDTITIKDYWKTSKDSRCMFEEINRAISCALEMNETLSIETPAMLAGDNGAITYVSGAKDDKK